MVSTLSLPLLISRRLEWSSPTTNAAQSGENPNDNLLAACRQGSLPDAQRQVHVYGAAVDAVDPETGTTPLHAAVAEGHLAIATWLLEWTALMQSTLTDAPIEEEGDDHADGTPLIGRASVIDLLRATDLSGNTPLHYACVNGDAAMVRAMAAALQATSPRAFRAAWTDLLDQRNHMQRTPAEWARAKNKAHMARVVENLVPP